MQRAPTCSSINVLYNAYCFHFTNFFKTSLFYRPKFLFRAHSVFLMRSSAMFCELFPRTHTRLFLKDLLGDTKTQ